MNTQIMLYQSKVLTPHAITCNMHALCWMKFDLDSALFPSKALAAELFDGENKMIRLDALHALRHVVI